MTVTAEMGGKRPPGLHINELNIIRLAYTEKTHRPPGERLADPELQSYLTHLGVDLTDKPSPFHDSRKGSLRKAASLETFTFEERQQMYDSFAWLREKYFAYRREEIPDKMTNHQFWRLGILGEALPVYLLLRANPISRTTLPEVAGNIFKASIGFRSVVRPHLEHETERPINTADEPYTTANKKQLFQQGDVSGFYTCAASKELINRTADAILFGNGADSRRSELPELITDAEFGNLVRFSEYHSAYEDAFIAVKNGRITREVLYATMADLQNKINESLGRDPQSIVPPTPAEIDGLLRIPPEFITPYGGPVQTAHAEVQKAHAELNAEGAEVYRQKQALAKEKIVFHQRTTGKKKKRK